MPTTSDSLDLDGTEDGEPDDTPTTTTTTRRQRRRRDGLDADAVPTGPSATRRSSPTSDVPEKELLALDTDALAEIADALGAAEVLETVR